MNANTFEKVGALAYKIDSSPPLMQSELHDLLCEFAEDALAQRDAELMPLSRRSKLSS